MRSIPIIKVSDIFYRKSFPSSKLTDKISSFCCRKSEILYIKIEPASILLPVKRRISKPPETNNNNANVINNPSNNDKDNEINKIMHDLEQYICDFCNVSFSSKTDLTLHIMQSKFPCEICTQHFEYNHQLKHHYTSEHGSETYPCSMCDYVSKSMSALQFHFIRNHGHNETGHKYECELCSKQFKIKNDLDTHMNRVHNGTPCICEICGHQSISLHALKSHFKFVHHKPGFKCKLCNRSMASQKYLDQHVFWHETREEQVCKTCRKAFKDKYALNKHRRTHTGEKPFECVICNNTFSRQTAYEQHVLTHMEKKMYSCDVCGKDFTQKSGLIFHRKKHKGPLPLLPAVSVRKVVQEFIAQFLSRRSMTSPESTLSEVH